ncbi:hypothetical protein [Methylomonas rhizoryzae]|uniref:hypothetical protein n=1 Tax=Methylomonas rhizoryzae TaxID=2608981 RepID=UPI001232DCA4|nr:hypothetical protein [Methylomonas rhizoryzae]
MWNRAIVVSMLSFLVSACVQEYEMFGSSTKKPIEEKMAEWLSHPAEFGVAPKSVSFIKTYNAKLISYGNVQIHLVSYTMPDGTVGRGFVNGGLTWSFLGSDLNAISDDDLFQAYCGWAWLFPALQDGSVQNKFESSGEEERFFDKLKKEGYSDIHPGGRYKIGTSELTEFRTKRNGTDFRGVGDTNSDLVFPASDPRFNLPSIYFFLGQQIVQSVN